MHVRPLFDALSAFHAAHPGVKLSLLEDGSDRLIERVRSGEADLALIGAAAMPEGLEGSTVISERVVAAVPAGHPLARRKRGITLADVAAHPVVCMPAGTGIRTVFDRGCAARGPRPDIALEASAPSAATDPAGRRLGVGILSASMVDDPLRALEIADLDAPALLALCGEQPTHPQSATSCATAAGRLRNAAQPRKPTLTGRPRFRPGTQSEHRARCPSRAPSGRAPANWDAAQSDHDA